MPLRAFSWSGSRLFGPKTRIVMANLLAWIHSAGVETRSAPFSIRGVDFAKVPFHTVISYPLFKNAETMATLATLIS